MEGYDSTIQQFIKKNIQQLQQKSTHIRKTEAYRSIGKPLNKEQEQLLRSKASVELRLKEFRLLSVKLFKQLHTGRLPFEFINPAPAPAPAPAPVEPGDKGRYLCVSDGFVIYCLDLKQSKHVSENDSQSLPIISTLNLLEKGLPVSMGLFKLGSDAYMVGGQEFPGVKDPNLDKAYFLYDMYGFKGTSRKIYHLSLADRRRLSLSETNKFPPLKKPKFWPIVEKIGDQIHVIESLPAGLTFDYPPTFPSHEVLDLNRLDCGWIKLPSLHSPKDDERGMYIQNHLVVGDRIYAKALCAPYPPGTSAALVFDYKWDSDDSNIMNLHEGGIGRCVGTFLHGSAPLNVVIQITNVAKGLIYDADGYPCLEMTAVAELISPTGHVYCIQNLPRFFEGLKRPSYMSRATLFSVDKESKTMCVVVLGSEVGTTRQDILFVSTFAVEFVADAAQVSRVCESGGDGVNGIIYPLEFVNVIMEDSHVYKLDIDLWPAGTVPPRLTACFLPLAP